MAEPTPFFSGKSVKLAFLLDNDKVEFVAKSVSVKENATIVADDVNGEDRSRLQKIVNFYEWNIECFQSNLDQLKALLRDSQQLDTMTQPLEKGCAVLVTPLDGSRSAFEGRQFCLDDWQFNASGRTERVMLTVPGRSRYFDQVKTI